MDDIDGNAQEAELNALNVGKTYKDATTGIVKQKDATVNHTTLGIETRIQERHRHHTYDYQKRGRHDYSRDRSDSRERKRSRQSPRWMRLRIALKFQQS